LPASWNFLAAYKSPKVLLFHLIATMKSKKKAIMVLNTKVKATGETNYNTTYCCRNSNVHLDSKA